VIAVAKLPQTLFQRQFIGQRLWCFFSGFRVRPMRHLPQILLFWNALPYQLSFVRYL